MKKILCGALVLLAAVVAFSGCKKKDNGGDESVTALTLTATELSMNPNDKQNITVRTNTGKVVTYEWTTDDESQDVITVVPKGSTATITAVGLGEATITVNVKGNKDVSAECHVTVTDKVQSLTFSRLSYYYQEPPANIDSTDVHIYSTFINKYTGEKDTLWCYLGDITFHILADNDMKVDNDGYLVGADKNNYSYTIEATGYAAVIARCLNEKLFDLLAENAENEETKQALLNPTYWELGTLIGTNGQSWEADGKRLEHRLIPGEIDEAKYVELMGKTFTEVWNPEAQSEEEMEPFWEARDNAVAQSIQGAYLAQWYYSETYGRWMQSPFPAGIVTTLNMRVLHNTHTEEMGYLYTSVIEHADIVFRPFGGFENYGLDMTQSQVTQKYTLNSNEVQWNPTVEIHF
jgi:hypothetical protein